MRMCQVFMAFPTGSEAFAAVEIRALRRQGVDVSVHSLRPAFPFAERMLAERELSDLPLTHGSLSNQFRGLLLGVLHPLLLWSLLCYTVVSVWRRPSEMFRCFACIPRSVQIFFEINELGRMSCIYTGGITRDWWAIWS